MLEKDSLMFTTAHVEFLLFGAGDVELELGNSCTDMLF